MTPSYAVLGATGSTGGAILTLLQRQHHQTINVYVRSKAKLLAQHPSLAASPNSSVNIFEGPLTDIELIASCIRNTHAVFLTVAVNDNVPHTTVAQDTARVVLAALERLRSEGGSDGRLPVPKLIVLSAAAIDDHLMTGVPRIVRGLLRVAFSWLYKDLIRAEKLLREHDAVNVAFVKPGALVQDKEQRGHEMSTERAGSGCLGYLDLARGMIEIAEEGQDGTTSWRWEGKNVSVVPKGKGSKMEGKMPIVLVRGLVFHFVPGIYRWLK